MAESAPRQATARDFLSVIFRRKWIILTIFGVATGTVLLVNLTSPVYYESTARVLVSRGEKQGVFEQGYKLLPREEDLSSEVELVRSEPVIKNAQSLLDTRRRAAGASRIVLRSDHAYGAVVGESNVVEINYQDQLSSVCRDAANAITDSYIAFHEQIRSLPQVDSFFAQQLTQTQQELRYWQTARSNYLASHEMLGNETERTYLLKELDDERVIQAEQNRQLAGAEREMASMNDLMKGPQAVDVPFTSNVQIGNEAVISDLKTRLSAANVALTEATARYAPESQPVEVAKATVNRLETLLHQEVQNRTRLLRQEMEVLHAKQAATQAHIAALESKLREYPGRQETVDDMERRIRTLQDNYKELSTKFLEAQINKASTTPSFMVTKLSSASYPVPKNTKDYVRLILAPVLSLVVGLGLAFFIENLDHSIATADAVEDELGLPLLASVREVR
jgi:uncharacterized protein involved in exopolysaccharide biosynthesis